MQYVYFWFWIDVMSPEMATRISNMAAQNPQMAIKMKMSTVLRVLGSKTMQHGYNWIGDVRNKKTPQP